METLIGHEHKSFVLHNGESARGAKLAQAKRCGLGGKPVSGVERIGVAIPENVAMEFVGAALQSNINYRSAFDSEFDSRIGLNIEFRNALKRNQGGSGSRDGSLAQGRLAIIAVVVGNTVDSKVVRCRPLPVDVEALKTAAWAALHSRHAIQEVVEIAAVVGQVSHRLVVKQGAKAILSGLDQGRDGLHLHGLGSVSDEGG